MIDRRLVALKDRGYHAENILDIGAHVGDVALQFKELWPYCDITCVEANPAAEEVLKSKNLKYKIALLSDATGKEVNFHISTEWELSCGNSVYKENTDSFSEGKYRIQRMTTTTLDNLFLGQEFDFIKVDTQGSEIDILNGGKLLLRTAKYIMTEASLQEYNIGGAKIGQTFEFMTRNGFVLDDIFSPIYNNKNILMQTNLLFKRKE